MRIHSFGTVMLALIIPVTSFAATGQRPQGDSERLIIVRTVEDPGVSNVPAACPFESPQVLLGATAWAVQIRASDGEVVNRDVRPLGTAIACGRITAPLAPFNQVPFYVEFNLDDGVIAAQGFCTVTSNNVPRSGLILAGCTLTVVAAPAGIAGGSVTSNSVFNPLRLPGFDTGSIWTLRLYPTP